MPLRSPVSAGSSSGSEAVRHGGVFRSKWVTTRSTICSAISR